MRFGQLEVRTIATLLLSRFALELPEGFRLSIRQMPTISPREGLPMSVHPRRRGDAHADADAGPAGDASGAAHRSRARSVTA
jgi:hypothetical protein